MLQNRCKGIDFLPNNQKKTHKKSQTCIFLFGLTMHIMIDGIISTVSWRILWNYNVMAS